ncbi:MAG: hypothetical protein PUC74_05790 [Succinatimonas sp.]|jgi:hypothetical protein|nr:hypothetical protein [Succinatimonas sp.]MDD5868881.1 hypothetical protein [Succinatimonas sp.]MDY5721147.1 hypothetical protein [Succinivibrio sp.]
MTEQDIQKQNRKHKIMRMVMIAEMVIVAIIFNVVIWCGSTLPQGEVVIFSVFSVLITIVCIYFVLKNYKVVKTDK